MGKDEETCTLCLNIINDKNFKVIEEVIKEVLNVLFIKLRVEDNKSVICNACSIKLFAAFNFKAICMDTEDSIFPYVSSENAAPVDLKEIYLKEINKGHLSTIFGDERICRLCMRVITSGFTTVKEVERDMAHNYIPEVNFNSTKEPVICKVCLFSLETHNIFLKKCLDVTRKIENIDDEKEAKNAFHVISENIDIKSDEDDENGEAPIHDSAEFIDRNPISVRMTKNNKALKYRRSKNKKQSKVYKCEFCTFEGKYKSSIIRHTLTHSKKVSKSVLYECDVCDYRCKQKGNLMIHQLTHKHPTEIQMFECDKCNYRTKQKKHLRNHQITHNNFSDVKTYECHLCNFKTKHRGSIVGHVLIHSTIKIYRCDICDYKSNKKCYLKNHQRKHKQASEGCLYQCDKCDFKTKYKESIQGHELRHKDPSEVQMHGCDKCSYKTKFRSELKKHQITHEDLSNVRAYQCDKCDYRAKRKKNLISHQLIHKKLSEVTLHSCAYCDYKLRYKNGVKYHELTHVHTEMYKCNECIYESKLKGSLITHMLTHKDLTEIRLYQCDTCSYKTKYKSSLKKHQLGHENSSKKKRRLNVRSVNTELN